MKKDTVIVFNLQNISISIKILDSFCLRIRIDYFNVRAVFILKEKLISWLVHLIAISNKLSSAVETFAALLENYKAEGLKDFENKLQQRNL